VTSAIELLKGYKMVCKHHWKMLSCMTLCQALCADISALWVLSVEIGCRCELILSTTRILSISSDSAQIIVGSDMKISKKKHLWLTRISSTLFSRQIYRFLLIFSRFWPRKPWFECRILCYSKSALKTEWIYANWDFFRQVSFFRKIQP